MKIAVCIKQVPDPRVAASPERRGDVDSRAGRQLRVERARRVRAGRSAAAAREAQRGSGGVRAPDRRVCSRSSGRRSRAVRTGPSTSRTIRLRSADAVRHVGGARVGHGGRAFRSGAHRTAVRRSGTRTGRRDACRAAADPALDDHHGSASRGRSAAREARARGRMVPVDRACPCRRC